MTTMSTTNKKLLLKYFFVLLVLFISAAILSSNEGVKHSNTNYFLESRASRIIKKPDFSEIKNFKERKDVFIKYMLAAIELANKEICLQQQQIQKLKNDLGKKGLLSARQNKKLSSYLEYYKIKTNHSIADDLDYLSVKVGMIPTSFVLAQAALESGWGTSRFAKDYNNYFGLHCFYEGCGVKAQASDIYLEIFNNVPESVLGYYHRLNTGSKFVDFRITREKIINHQLPQKALLDTLENYSELDGGEYKDRIISVIQHNNLRQYDSIKYC
ncbi:MULTISPECIES: glucosaminidase domain-containing protein [Francisella]|uniref:BAX protein n=1 Tax=Francisella opportunistica TaxID=2016517 RepID=A0A345JQI8_9GAMM|nr:MULTISPECIES: glucosaminidase domain-containing protein [Francisella]APC91289.1 BAX protein [Francisella sp. MA067296]AXH29584.1 BAX protein [Francisella opportunistica]AXH31235.1 BAX protein [Francisella opportunistica]AXH32882.1 BAX protein [Francisella opportunistica]